MAAAVALPLRPLGLPLRPRPLPHRPPPRERAPKPAPQERAPRVAAPLGERIRTSVASLPDHPWLDRVVRGRVWIPLLGILLAGIVAAQVEILKLGANMGRSLEQTSTLTTQNEQLRWNVAALGDDQRIERLASATGMVMPPPGAVGYLAAKPRGDIRGAIANLHPPDPSAFVLLTASNGALVTGSGTSMLPSGSSPVLAPAPAPGAATSSTGTTSTSTELQATTTSTAPQASATTESTTTSPSATGAAAVQPAASSQSSTGG